MQTLLLTSHHLKRQRRRLRISAPVPASLSALSNSLTLPPQQRRALRLSIGLPRPLVLVQARLRHALRRLSQGQQTRSSFRAFLQNLDSQQLWRKPCPGPQHQCRTARNHRPSPVNLSAARVYLLSNSHLGSLLVRRWE